MAFQTRGEKLFSAVNHVFLALMALVCVFPMLHVLALSFSASTAAASGRVVLWPVDWTLQSYRFVLENSAFVRAFGISVQRVLLGVPLNLLLTVITAYPLSRNTEEFGAKRIFTWFFLITMIFGGGLIPWYMVIQRTGLIDRIWALILPSALPLFNTVLLINYLRGLPRELEEAAGMDGAGHWTILVRILLPLSLPLLATVALFSVVFHWNSWFDGLILMNSPAKYPLQSYLQTLVINRDPRLMSERDVGLLKLINERTTRSAQIIVAMAPIVCVYPFFQKYFTVGIMLGAVKG